MNSSDTDAYSLPFATPGEILAAAIVLPVLGILTVVLRFVARSKQGSPLGRDDGTIVAALVGLSNLPEHFVSDVIFVSSAPSLLAYASSTVSFAS